MDQPQLPFNPPQPGPRLEIKIDAELLKQQAIFVGTPMYGGMCSGLFSRSIADLSAICAHHGIHLQLHFLFNESLITRARNYICDEFMRSVSTHLMFIDADIGFDAKDVIALLALQSQKPEYDIIGGPYAKKCISWEKVIQAVNKGLGDQNPGELEKYIGDFVFNPKDGQSQIPLFQPTEVREVGTGFMMVSKNSFERFNKAYPHYLYKPDHIRTEHFDGSREIMQYFQAEIDGIDFAKEYRVLLDEILNSDIAFASKSNHDWLETKLKEIQGRADQRSKRYLSEDYWFSQRCHEIGIRTWLCPWMRLMHMGSYVFSGSLVDLAQAGAAATADAGLIKKGKK